MTGEELLAALADAGLVPVWTDAGLRVRGDPKALTLELRRLMKFHREWLESRFRPNTMPRETEFMWQDTGLVDGRWRPGLGRPLPDFWRYVGESDWRPMPRRAD
jgi:hypothetical protein